MADARVLHVLEALEGGTARHLVDLVRTAAGVEHHVAVPRQRVGGLTDRAAAGHMADAGAVVHLVDMRRSPLRVHNAAALASLVALARRTGPGLLHGHSSIGGALGRVAGTIARRPRVYTPNGLAPGRAAAAAERALGPLTDLMIATSASEAELVVARRLVPERRIVTIPNGIPVEGWAPPPGTPDLRRLLGLPPGVPLVGTISRLVDQKAPERFIRLAAAVLTARPDVHALLVGDGPRRDAVDPDHLPAGAAARFHHLPSLERAGDMLGQLDVFVLTSRFEGCPYSALEAMRAATPVVLTDVVGNREVVTDGLSGHLVAEEDGAAMASLVLDLLSDGERRLELGAAGREHVRAFEVAEMGRAVAARYAALMEGGRR